MDELKRVLTALRHPPGDFRIKLWRAYLGANSLREALATLPTKSDSWVSAFGKVMSFLGQLEAQTGVLFGGKAWYEVEREAKDLVLTNLSALFFEKSEAILSETIEERGPSSKLRTVTTRNGVVLQVPLRRSYYSNEYQQEDEFVLVKNEETLEQFLDEVWEGYANQVFVDVPGGLNIKYFGNPPLTYTPIPQCQDECIGRKDLLEQVQREFTGARIDQQKRAWLLLGPPGTGKTTFVQHLVRSVNGRFMQLSYSTLNRMSFNEILLAKPDFLMLDDVDRAHSGILKEALDRLNGTKMMIFITANDISQFDDAILRPGRIEKIIEFSLPNRAERKDVIEHYLRVFRAPPVSDLEEVLDMTEGLSQAHCKSVASDLHRDPYQAVVENLKTMQRLQKAKTKEPADAPKK
jgi:hypothetical protein